MFITYFCYKCECKEFGKITLEEFSRGVQSFKVDTLASVKSHVLKAKESMLLVSSDNFKKFWIFLFEYNLVDKKKKVLDYEYVELFFNKLLGTQFKIVSTFMKFYVDVKNKEQIKQDQWNCFLDFCLKIGDNFPKGYSTKDSWPTILDEFYMDYCEKNNIEIEQEDS